MDVKIALIGGGNVGQGFLSALRNKKEQIIDRHGISFDLVAVCDRKYGSILSSDALAIKEVLPLLEDGIGFHDYRSLDRATVKELEPISIIELSRADVVVECIHSDPEKGEPATRYCETALAMRKHVITSNKWPIALHYQRLQQIARSHDVRLLFGATVMSGTPVIDILSNNFFANEVREIKGALSVSTNFMFEAMEKGADFDAALQVPREKGFLEADPALDLDGYDAMAKLMILLNVLTTRQIDAGCILREGIRNINPRDVQTAAGQGKRYRMVAHALLNEQAEWQGFVGPHKLDEKDPLYHVSEHRNALKIRHHVLGDILLEGPGAGKLEAGYAILSDLLSIYV
ncbi:MAG: hypothetical protein JXQ27_15340 [Acidobacteria bacterium]|nr:hypothetical protein [Acidobacteriota bacterium]